MNARLAVDANAVIDSLRSRPEHRAPLDTDAEIVLPLPVLGELYFGAFASAKQEANDRWPQRHPLVTWTIHSGCKKMSL